MKYRNAMLLVIAILVIDQLSKIYIKLNFRIGEYVNIIGDWSKLYFIENDGMAFGFTLSDEAIGKLILTLFRLGAVTFGFFFIKKLIKKGHTKGLIICASLILAGAAGNLIDSLFYGMIFTESTTFQKAALVAWGEGYGDMLHGKVVDMLYFPMIDTIWPQWVPYFGGKKLEFFQPIFNVADVSISTGVITMLVFQKRFMPEKKTTPESTVSHPKNQEQIK